MNEFITMLNDNQGVISFVALVLVIPLAIGSDRLLIYYKRRKQRDDIKRLLLHELWVNINFVGQIERSYLNNFNEDGGVHIPYYPPRTDVLAKFVDYSLIDSLPYYEKSGVIEVYAQLEGLKHEYTLWRKLLVETPIITDKEIYSLMSDTMLSYIEPVMKNMLELWLKTVHEVGNFSNVPQIRELSRLMKQEIKRGKWIRTTYKASFYNKPEFINAPKFDAIMCWVNDWPTAPKEVIELKNLVPIHKSWSE